MNWKDLSFWKSSEWSKIQELISLKGEVYTPEPRLILRPLIETPLPKLKVVFLCLEPYCLEGCADGLALSFRPNEVNKNYASSPIYHHELMLELFRDQRVKPPKDGSLLRWARQGVLLWNSRPITLKGRTSGGIGMGWEQLTAEIIETAYLNNPKTVFVSFGEDVFNTYLAGMPNDCLRVPLPLPVSSLLNGKESFAGSKPFSLINQILREHQRKPIDWRV